MKNNIIFLIFLTMINISSATGAVIFTDWQTINTTTETATGILGSVSVLMTGSDLDIGVTDGSSTFFDFSFFTPSLALSDYVGFRGNVSASNYEYTIDLVGQVTNPIIHLRSLASDLTFPGITIDRLSGQTSFGVLGDTVSGTLIDGTIPNDANGTIRLQGTFSSINFTAISSGSFEDGIFLQIGADENDISAVPVPAAVWLFSSGLIGLLGMTRHKAA